MKSFWKWIVGISLGLLALLIAVPVIFRIVQFFMFGPERWEMGRMFPDRFHSVEMMGPYFTHMSPFGMWGGSFMWLVPVVLIVLLIAGVVAIVKMLRQPAVQPAAAAGIASSAVSAAPIVPPTPEAPGRVCASCGRPADAEWKVCPYCTELLG